MLDVARGLYFSKSIDLSHEEEHFFNLSMVNSGHLFSCLHEDRVRRGYSASCEREQVVEERVPMFGRWSDLRRK